MKLPVVLRTGAWLEWCAGILAASLLEGSNVGGGQTREEEDFGSEHVEK